MIYISDAMQEAMSALEMIADLWRAGEELDLCVYLSGETGAGKSVAALMLANRAGLTLCSDNIGAATQTLIASRLFGHRRGSYSGATSNRDGLIKSAGKGAVFLDEISSLPLESQAVLLELLQERKYRPVGSDVEHPVHCSFIFAAADLKVNVADGEFRRDLYYRVAGYEVSIPSLRSRPEDIKPLWEHFAPGVVLTAGALEILRDYDWPGNVRELQHMARLAKVRKASELTREDAQKMASKGARSLVSVRGLDAHARREVISGTLRVLGRSAISRIAAEISMPMWTLRRDLTALWSDGAVVIYGTGSQTEYEVS